MRGQLCPTTVYANAKGDRSTMKGIVLFVGKAVLLDVLVVSMMIQLSVLSAWPMVSCLKMEYVSAITLMRPLIRRVLVWSVG